MFFRKRKNIFNENNFALAIIKNVYIQIAIY